MTDRLTEALNKRKARQAEEKPKAASQEIRAINVLSDAVRGQAEALERMEKQNQSAASETREMNKATLEVLADLQRREQKPIEFSDAAIEKLGKAIGENTPAPIVNVEARKPVAYQVTDITRDRHRDISGARLVPEVG